MLRWTLQCHWLAQRKKPIRPCVCIQPKAWLARCSVSAASGYELGLNAQASKLCAMVDAMAVASRGEARPTRRGDSWANRGADLAEQIWQCARSSPTHQVRRLKSKQKRRLGQPGEAHQGNRGKLKTRPTRRGTNRPKPILPTIQSTSPPGRTESAGSTLACQPQPTQKTTKISALHGEPAEKTQHLWRLG